MDINVLISNPEYFSDLLEMPEITGIYVEQERVGAQKYKSMVKAAHEAGKNIYLALPYVWNGGVEFALNRRISSLASADGDGYLIRNLDELGLLSERNARGKMILDACMYTWNSESIKMLEKLGANVFTAPLELNKHELDERGYYHTEIVAYGYYPAMVSNNCIRLTKKSCAKDRDPFGVMKLEDRKGVSFPVMNRCKYCYNVIYNSVPTWLLDEDEIYSGDSVRLEFTVESRLEMKAILSRYFDGDAKPNGSITRGHYKRGAE